MKPTAILTAALLCALSPISFAKPLKVFMLAGQSNMQGHANTSTFDYIGKDPLTAPILAAMRDAQDKPRVCENVWISSLGCGGNQYSDMLEKTGKLTAGFGASESEIGPEFTFGIYIEKMLKEPVLIIKTSWGGRSLNTDFRPPGAGPYKLPKEIQEVWDKYPQGAHGVPKLEEALNCDSYRIAVLARQGFHVYLNGQKIHTYIWWADKPQYGSIVLTEEQIKHLKKGKNVLAAYANDQYDLESPAHYAAIDVRIEGITKADQAKLDLALEEVLSPKDREALKGASNGGYHYFGSAKIFALMGKAFAEAILNLQK